MSLYQCDCCGCVENTNTGAQSIPEVFQTYFDWTGIEDKRNMKLCSACGPTKYSDGKPTKYGVWHNIFKRTFLPKGMFKTARNGNLAHKETGEENYFLYAIPEPVEFCQQERSE